MHTLVTKTKHEYFKVGGSLEVDRWRTKFRSTHCAIRVEAHFGWTTVGFQWFLY